jgi:hypothetical protein
MPTKEARKLTAFDESITPMRGQMLVEPQHQEEKISLLGGIIEKVTSVPASIRATVIKFGPMDKAVDFRIGDLIEIVPHGGTILLAPDKHPERMVIPVALAIGLWED